MNNTLKDGHHKGLYLLFFVEMWERFSYYGMRALLVLYMIQTLMYSTREAGTIYGWYTGLVYLTPLLGGYLADRYFGQRKCITAGAICMAIGLFLLAFGSKSLFLLSLFFIIASNGLIKSNISSVLGLMYNDNERKKDSAFTIFYMGINLGAFLSPLVCGALAVKYGFEAGFAAAGVGMTIGLCAYKIFENKLLGESGLYPIRTIVKDESKNSITSTQKQQITSLIILILFTIPFWICFEQAGSSLTLFAEYSTNRNLFGFVIPTGYFQSLNPVFILILAPIISILWENLRQKNIEPTSVEKFGIALFLMTVAYIIIAIAGYHSDKSLVSPMWLIICYFVMTIAELCLSPIGLSLVSKLAPKQFLSLTMGTWFLMNFSGNLLAGFIGGEYENIPHWILFGSLALLSFTTFITLIFFRKKLNKALNYNE